MEVLQKEDITIWEEGIEGEGEWLVEVDVNYHKGSRQKNKS